MSVAFHNEVKALVKALEERLERAELRLALIENKPKVGRPPQERKVG
jgi:hypothetical protein